MRHTTVRMALPTLRWGSSVSAAATETISVPPNAKITTNRAAATPPRPCGAKLSVRFAAPGESTPGSRPRSRAAPTPRNRTMTATLRMANQNSNSPKFRTPARLMPVKTTMKSSVSAQTGTTGQTENSSPAAPRASAAMTTTSCSHHSHPMVAPAVRPRARSAYTEKAPLAGLAAAISPSAHITRMISVPATRYETSTAGPAAWTPAPDPRNSPAPMALPNPIMVSWRGFMLWPAAAFVGMAADVVRPDFVVMGAMHLLGAGGWGGPLGAGVLVGPFEFTASGTCPETTAGRKGVERRQNRFLSRRPWHQAEAAEIFPFRVCGVLELVLVKMTITKRRGRP